MGYNGVVEGPWQFYLGWEINRDFREDYESSKAIAYSSGMTTLISEK